MLYRTHPYKNWHACLPGEGQGEGEPVSMKEWRSSDDESRTSFTASCPVPVPLHPAWTSFTASCPVPVPLHPARTSFTASCPVPVPLQPAVDPPEGPAWTLPGPCLDLEASCMFQKTHIGRGRACITAPRLPNPAGGQHAPLLGVDEAIGQLRLHPYQEAEQADLALQLRLHGRDVSTPRSPGPWWPAWGFRGQTLQAPGAGDPTSPTIGFRPSPSHPP